jgi:hypothetical protein
MEPLFIEHGLTFEKLAAGSKMPEDPNQWPQEILQELYKQCPFTSDFQPEVVLQKSDAERGYGWGHVLITHQTEAQADAPPEARAAAGLREVRIPIVVKDGVLAPMDLLVTDDSKVLPLTEARVREAIFRPQAFDVTSKTPGDQSMIGQLYPPYRQNYGMGGGGVAMSAGTAKEGSAQASLFEEYLTEDLEKAAADPHADEGTVAEGMMPGTEGYHSDQMREALAKKDSGPDVANAKKASVIDAILPTMNTSDVEALMSTLNDRDVKLACQQNSQAVYPSLERILNREEAKMASITDLVTPTVLQVVKTDDGYRVKTASHKMWDPQASHKMWDPQVFEIDRGQALRSLGPEVVKAADVSGAATLAEGAAAEAPGEPDTDMQQMGPVTEPGMYKVQAEDGGELVGYVIPGLIDTDGQEVPLALFTNGSQSAIQADILGVPVPGDMGGLPTADAPQGMGAFFSVEGDELQCTVPMTISASMTGPDPAEPVTMQAETFDGRPAEVSLQPNIQTVVASPEGKMLIPGHWQWTPLGDQGTVALASSEPEVSKQGEALRKLASVEVLSSGDEYTIRGLPVEKLAADQRQWVDIDGAMFLLAGLGVDQAYGMRKLAEAQTGQAPVEVRIGRLIKTAKERKEQARIAAAAMSIPALRRQLFKEAAVVTDPDAVDAVLSLGFINPENITTFIDYLPQLDCAQSKLCELLMASRLGLSDVPEGALEKSVRAMEEVLEGLKALAFQSPAEYN